MFWIDNSKYPPLLVQWETVAKTEKKLELISVTAKNESIDIDIFIERMLFRMVDGELFVDEQEKMDF